VSSYTVANLKDLEDAAPRFDLSPALEARFARGSLGADQIGLSYQPMRAFEVGPEGAELLAIGAPVAGRNDAEMEPGWWSD
jgi:hypothetical protein